MKTSAAMPPAAAMSATQPSQIHEYRHAPRQVPETHNPASGTTAAMHSR